MDRIGAIADKLAADWWERAPYAALTGEMAPADLDEAYRVQGALQQRLAERRGPMAGRKIALSSAAMQAMVGISSPIAGAFFARDVYRSPARVEAAGFRHMGLEYEMAFEMARDVIPGEAHDRDSVRGLIGAVRPAFELIEDRDADYADLDALTLVADNAWCGGVVLGEPIAGWEGMDLAAQPVVLEQAGQPPESAVTGAADPLGSLAWVLTHFGDRGETVQAGEVIITGSVMKTRFPQPGDRFRYVIGGRWAVELAVV